MCNIHYGRSTLPQQSPPVRHNKHQSLQFSIWYQHFRGEFLSEFYHFVFFTSVENQLSLFDDNWEKTQLCWCDENLLQFVSLALKSVNRYMWIERWQFRALLVCVTANRRETINSQQIEPYWKKNRAKMNIENKRRRGKLSLCSWNCSSNEFLEWIAFQATFSKLLSRKAIFWDFENEKRQFLVNVLMRKKLNAVQ